MDTLLRTHLACGFCTRGGETKSGCYLRGIWNKISLPLTARTNHWPLQNSCLATTSWKGHWSVILHSILQNHQTSNWDSFLAKLMIIKLVQFFFSISSSSSNNNSRSSTNMPNGPCTDKLWTMSFGKSGTHDDSRTKCISVIQNKEQFMISICFKFGITKNNAEALMLNTWKTKIMDE